MFASATPPETESGRPMSWTEYPADGTTAMVLDQVERSADPFDQLERIGAWERIISWAQARQYTEITRFVADTESAPSHGMTEEQAGESAQAEIGLILTLSPGGTAWRVSDAQRLVDRFPATLAALQTGAITLAKARIVAEGGTDLGSEAAAAVEARVLPRASRQTNGQLRAAVARAVKREDADAAERRRRRRQRERAVVLHPERDGMATLSATLPAAEAVGAFAVLDEHARACGGADDRSMDARRADALVDLVLRDTGFCSDGGQPATGDESTDETATPDVPTPDAATPDAATPDAATPDAAADQNGTARPGPAPTPTPSRLPGVANGCGVRTVTNSVSIQIRVIVGLDALRGVDDEPAELAGYGPITAAQARELAADPSSTWRRLITDPRSGAILDYGTTRYRPPPDMAERVISRHQHCQYPGCRVPAHRCDLDHNEPFNPDTGTGPTSDANLGPKCRPHHRLKGRRGWNVHQYDDGTIVWITPSGHNYLVEPPPLTEARPIGGEPATDDDPPPF